MVRCAASRNAPVMVADVGGMSSDMRDPGGFPELDFLAPIVFITDAWRDPYFETQFGWIASGFARQPPQLLESSKGSIAGWVNKRHEAVTILRCTKESRFGVSAKPDRHPPRSGPRVDPYIIKTMEFSIEPD